ncbi:hypothetical protein [Kitasatospora sp. NPDC002040]|uniref:hypothetical protein n=1 Tax=Kitasatospora sp. NPDC002040 TaxID=3154661 RepID=UPI003331A107
MTDDQETAGAERGFRRTVLLLGAVLLFALVAQLPPGQGGSAPGSRARELAGMIWPQGWNLFDDGQYAPETVAYLAGPGGWTEAMLTPHGRPGSGWGMNKSDRTQIKEIEALTALLRPDSWLRCEAAELDDCHWPDTGAPGAPAPRPLDNPAARPTLCGEVALTRERLARWGSGQAGQWWIEAAVLLRVSCS